MIKAHIYFRTIDPKTVKILNEMRRNHLPVKIWVSNSDKEYCIKYRIRDIDFIDHPATDKSIGCYAWDLHNTTVTPHYDNLQHLLTRINEIGDKFICINNTAPKRGYLVLFQDCLHKNDFPIGFFTIPTYDNYYNIKAYIDELPLIFELSNNPKFKRTQELYQGQAIYREISQNQYWYLDNLHKNHYEVFDSKGDHIGEADMNGNINSGKRDSRKHIKL